MGYYIKKLPHKKTLPLWKVQYISWKQEDTQKSTAKKSKREWDIRKSRWQSLGFVDSMSIEEAKARARQLNCQLQIKRQEQQIIRIAEAQMKFQLRHDAVLPSEFVNEFEARFIRKKDSQTEQGKRRFSRAYTQWKASQRLIVAINLDPSDWYLNMDLLYDWKKEQLDLAELARLRWVERWKYERLAEYFGVGRTTVRDCIRAIKVKPGLAGLNSKPPMIRGG